jgi:hypothetical protein
VRSHPTGPESAQQFMVPRGARAVICRRCGEPVYWLVVRSRRVAVTCDQGEPPTQLADGHGVNHAPYCKRRRLDPYSSEAARKAVGRGSP